MELQRSSRPGFAARARGTYCPRPAIDCTDDAAIVSIESVGSSQCQRSTLISKVCSTVESTRCGKPGIQPAAQPKICIGLENDVDDARHAVGIVLGRWIGNYFDPFH